MKLHASGARVTRSRFCHLIDDKIAEVPTPLIRIYPVTVRLD